MLGGSKINSSTQATILGGARAFKRRVYFTGSTALVKGQGVCYDRDYTGSGAGNSVGARDYMVELPSISNNLWFAGVTAKAYAAVAGGQWIEIYEPGSVCEIALAGLGTLIGSTMLTCMTTNGVAGRFGRAGFPGRGSALALATKSAGGSAADSPATEIYAEDFTVADHKINVVDIHQKVQAGDTAVVLCGAEDDGGAGITAYATTVASTGSNYVILTNDPETENAHVSVTFFRGNPRVMALLLDGEESGLTQYTAAYSNTGITEPITMGGVTFLCGGITIATGDYSHAIPIAVKGVRRKGFLLDGNYTTNDFLVTGIHSAAGAALTSFELDADGECLLLEAALGKWFVQGGLGTAT